MRDARSRLEAQAQALRHANARLEQFVHIASHDLREPLNTVAQFGGLIEQDHGAALPPDGREYLRLIRQATGRMRRLLDDVLHYARLQDGAAGPRERVDLNAVFRELRESLASRIEATGAALEVGPLPVVPGHAALLSLLFQNLLANALKFVPPGRAPQVRVHAALGQRAVVITVLDNGIGIDAADLPKLFRPFQRLHLQRQYEGTGLGLALCRQVADAHGGRIQVESVPGEGSRFHVRLPLR
jgi:signal transduction histidine kinase